MGDVRPEAAYFAVENGQRTVYMIVDVADSADMVRVAEPLWLALEANVETIPAMTAEEFATAGAKIGEVVAKY